MIDADLNRRAEEAKAEIEHEMRLLATEEKEEARRAAEPRFEAVGEGRYCQTRPGLTIEVDCLRRVNGALKGEVIVKTTIPGARTTGSTLSAEDLNFSSSRGRSSFAKHLAQRSKIKETEFDWIGFVEDFAVEVLAAERNGQPSVLLSDLPRPQPDRALEVDGLRLLARNPTVIFGDGGTAKSYLALWIAGRLAQRGSRVGFFDWELSGEDHRDRLERLFGQDMPTVHYARCSRPLVFEIDRLRRIVRDERLDFCVFDSISFATDGPAESHESAQRYQSSLRQLGPIGSLHLAHISKAVDGADRKPFGSVFWYNFARACWNIKRSDPMPDEAAVTVALHDRKFNLGAQRASVGFEFTFEGDRTHVRRVDVADHPDLAVGMSVPQRMALALRRGAMSPEELAEEIEAEVATVKRNARRYRDRFTLLNGGRVGLLERRI